MFSCRHVLRVGFMVFMVKGKQVWLTDTEFLAAPTMPRYAQWFAWSDDARWEWTTILLGASHEVFSLRVKERFYTMCASDVVVLCSHVLLCVHAKSQWVFFCLHRNGRFVRFVVVTCFARIWQPPQWTCSNQIHRLSASLSTANLFEFTELMFGSLIWADVGHSTLILNFTYSWSNDGKTVLFKCVAAFFFLARSHFHVSSTNLFHSGCLPAQSSYWR